MTKYKLIKTSDKIKRKGKIVKTSARAYLEIKKGKKRIISRRQYNKIKKITYKKATPLSQANTNRYKSFLHDYIDRQRESDKIGRVLSKKEARESSKFKKVLRNLKYGEYLRSKGDKRGNKIIIKALKETIRRDGIPDEEEAGKSNPHARDKE